LRYGAERRALDAVQGRGVRLAILLHYISPVIIDRSLEACNCVLKIVHTLVKVSQDDH
jgi:hypothetical protein